MDLFCQIDNNFLPNEKDSFAIWRPDFANLVGKYDMSSMTNMYLYPFSDVGNSAKSMDQWSPGRYAYTGLNG